MERKKKALVPEEIPEFQESINRMPEDSRIFVDRSLEIAEYIYQLMEYKGMKQKDLADKLGKSEAEVSKWLAGMHNYTLRSLSKLEAALGAAIICTPAQRFIHVPVTGKKISTKIEMEKLEEPQKAAINYTGKLINMKWKNELEKEVKAI